MSKHQVFHERSKNIDVRMHFVRDVISNGHVKVLKIGTEDNYANMFIKPILNEKN